MIVYKLLKTPKQCYVYDRNKNKILHINEDDYNELDLLKKNKISENEVTCLKKYQRYGYLQESVVEEVVHPETNYIKHHLEHRVKMLILQVTQNCNLRCAYCTYSGLYENRVHSNKMMDWDTAKEAIDYLFAHSNEVDQVTLSFYGGEPLLRFDLIKQCVAYVKSDYADRNVQFGMTTNGTLLNKEIGDFLVENHFSITISLDGSKKDHDANRVFANGQGSFDTIIKNIKELTSYNKEFIKNVRFNTVLNPKSDYGAVSNYFTTEDIVCDADIGMSFMETENCKEDIIFGEKFIDERRYAFFRLALTMIKKLDGITVPSFMISMKNGLDRLYTNLDEDGQLMKKCHHSGPCIPGSTRMFVSTDRKIYSCEKASDLSNTMQIGELGKDIDLEKVYQAMNFGKVSENDCKNCWAFSHCTMCALHAEKNGQFDLNAIRTNCADVKIDAVDNLLNICVLKELGYHFEKEELYV